MNRRETGFVAEDAVSAADLREGNTPQPRPHSLPHPSASHRLNHASQSVSDPHRVRSNTSKSALSHRTNFSDAVYGALDLGTNNCRLLVARPSRRGFLVIDAFSRIIKLGEGVSQSGVLSEAAIRRTIEALKVCSIKMARRGVTRSRLVATEACRIAKNGPEFVARVKHETGLSLEIIGRETEARLAVSGCASLIDKRSNYALIFDIGGGSSEFVWLNLAKEHRTKRVSIEDRLRMQDFYRGLDFSALWGGDFGGTFWQQIRRKHPFRGYGQSCPNAAFGLQRGQWHCRKNG